MHARDFLIFPPVTRPAVRVIPYDLIFAVQGLFVTKILRLSKIWSEAASALDSRAVTDRSESLRLFDFNGGSL
jgi:hypothetical protein